jgi:4-amino-4-deoxy-L-arabinose transferase-like glycosyltransferase
MEVKSFPANDQKSIIQKSIISIFQQPITWIMLLALGLYFYQLGTESLWIDELYSVYDAKQVPENLSMLRPVYSILLRFWMLFGTSAAWMRGLSVLFGLGSVFLVNRLGCWVAGRATGQIAALMMALSPLIVNHTQEVRMYALSIFLTVAGTLVLAYALEKPNLGLLGGWVLLRILSVLTTPLNITLFLPDVILLVFQFRHHRRLLKIIGISVFSISLLLSPLIFDLMKDAGPKFMGGWVASLEKPGIPEIAARLTNFTVWWPLTSLSFSKFAVAFYLFYTGIALCVLVVALFALRNHYRMRWIVLWGITPNLVILTASYLFSSLWIPRYILFTSPYILILLAFGFLRIATQKRQLAIGIAIIYFIAVGGGLTYYYSTNYRTDFRGIKEYIEQNQQPGDIVGLWVGYVRPKEALSYYFPDPNALQVLPYQPQDWPSSEGRLLVIFKHFPLQDFYRSRKEFVNDLNRHFNIEAEQRFLGSINRPDVTVFTVTPQMDRDKS